MKVVFCHSCKRIPQLSGHKERNSMKRAGVFGTISVICLISVSLATAQFYAPDTEFHDKAQRMFVVEAARVVAWRGNQDTKRVWEVTYSVRTDTNQVTIWDMSWLDKEGHAIKKFQVKYPEPLLKAGPQFYRDVFRQICSATQQSNPTNLTAVDMTKAFWRGAEL